MNNKGIMGIGTLIIFIATILVAAVAAGVIISTSGVLQQQSLLIADQSQQRLVNGIQITHVFMEGDLAQKTANNIEILARPEPASGPINFKTTSLSFFTNTAAYSATLSHPETIQLEFTPSVPITTDFVAFGDIDGDGVSDEIRLVTGAGNDFLEVNVSSLGVSELLPLGYDTSTTGMNVTREDIPIRVNGTVAGYIHLSGVQGTSGQIAAGTLTVTDEIRGECTFAKLRPDTRYCVVTMTGVDDAYLEYGETVFMYFKLSQSLSENEEYEVKIFSQDGRSTFVLNRVPGVIYKTRMSVFP
ncbi:MAG: archaellin/type IV pilin N-terminal domain-containing protein [Candidatus Woesearchaeota archaeon]